MASAGSGEFRLGFLAAVEDAERGVVGGLLLTNRFGRPLEFQCTAPIRPTRTQQLLYGPTLRPYLLAELIGRTLIEKANLAPDLVLTDSSELLDLRLHIASPVATVQDAGAAGDQSAGLTLPLGKCVLRFHPDHADDQALVASRKGVVPDSADLREPFDRVREALLETFRTPPVARSA